MCSARGSPRVVTHWAGVKCAATPSRPPPPPAAESSAPRRRPRARVSHARTPHWARPARGAHAAGGASRGLCVQTAQWAAAVGGAAGGAWPMGGGLSGLTDRRTHTHSATRAPPGPTRAAQLCAGRIVRSSRPPTSFRAAAPCARAPHREPSRDPDAKGARPGGSAGLARPAPRGTAGNSRPWAPGGQTRGARVAAGPVRLPAGAGPRLTPGHPWAAPAMAELLACFSSGPGWARLQPRPAHAPGPVGRGRAEPRPAGRPDSRRRAPAPRAGRPLVPPRADVSRRDFPGQNLREEESGDPAASSQPRAVPMFSCQAGSFQGQAVPASAFHNWE